MDTMLKSGRELQDGSAAVRRGVADAVRHQYEAVLAEELPAELAEALEGLSTLGGVRPRSVPGDGHGRDV